MSNCFNKNQINKIFREAFTNLFNRISQSIESKGIIEADEQLKQIRNEFNYIKKVFKLFPMVDTNKFKDIIDELSIKVNPNKLPPSKKKKSAQNKEKEEGTKDNEIKEKEKENKEEKIENKNEGS